MIPQDQVDRIFDTARIEDIVGDFVSLKRRGASFVACCPFHNEKTPSFYVTPSKGIYKCFGCGEAGTAVGFLMKHENLSYVDALKYIARRYGIEIQEEEESAEAIAARKRLESLMVVMEFARKFFIDSLQTEEGRTHGLAYCRSRGIEPETMAGFGLGWAPSGKRSFTDAALAAGYKEEYLIDTGMTIRYEDGRLVDRFRERVMFPICSVSGRVIAFSGRTLRSDKETAKYVNSSGTDIYVKSRALFGIFPAKSEISKKDKCYLVEGNIDVVSMHQLGIRNVVAPCGTALTVEQIQMIHKFTDNISLMFDGDGAGIHAAQRGIGMVLKEGMNVKVILLPGGQDPDDFCRKHSLEEAQEFFEANEQDFISFKSELLMKEAGNDPLKRAELINDIADTIAQIPDAIKRTVYVQDCSQKFDIRQDILLDRISRTRRTEIEEEQKRKAFRRSEEAERTAEQAVPAPAQVPARTAPAPRRGITDPDLAQTERSLLQYCLKYGCEQLLFLKGTQYYTEPPVTVLEFIDGTLCDDEVSFSNELYRKAYEMYVSLYDSGLDQDTIQRRMMDCEDREIADLTTELVIERYDVSMNALKSTMTARSTILTKYVPEALMRYHLARLDKQQKECTARLKSADEASQQEILRELAQINKLRNAVSQALNIAK